MRFIQLGLSRLEVIVTDAWNTNRHMIIVLQMTTHVFPKTKNIFLYWFADKNNFMSEFCTSYHMYSSFQMLLVFLCVVVVINLFRLYCFLFFFVMCVLQLLNFFLCTKSIIYIMFYNILLLFFKRDKKVPQVLLV